LLPTLAAHFPFETAIGMNGRVWVKAASVGEMIALHRILKGVDDGEVAVEKGELDKLARSLLA
jgi:exosome complex component RRP40